MAFTYAFLDAANTQLQRSDGAVVTIQRRQHLSAIGSAFGEQFRADGAKVTPFAGSQPVPIYQAWVMTN
jgi:hypothetical protein